MPKYENISMSWTDITCDWEKLPIETYKFLFEQAKERYSDVMSESESITEKAFKLISISGAVAAGFIGFKFQQNPNLWLTIGLAIFHLVNFACLIKLLFPKEIILRGSPPNETLINYFDDKNLEENEKSKLVYYQELIRYQERIDIMTLNITKRQRYYQLSLILTLFNTATSIGIVISAIYHHP
jgi:hypothetical protein